MTSCYPAVEGSFALTMRAKRGTKGLPGEANLPITKTSLYPEEYSWP